MRNRNCLPFASTGAHSQCFGGVHVANHVRSTWVHSQCFGGVHVARVEYLGVLTLSVLVGSMLLIHVLGVPGFWVHSQCFGGVHVARVPGLTLSVLVGSMLLIVLGVPGFTLSVLVGFMLLEYMLVESTWAHSQCFGGVHG